MLQMFRSVNMLNSSERRVAEYICSWRTYNNDGRRKQWCYFLPFSIPSGNVWIFFTFLKNFEITNSLHFIALWIYLQLIVVLTFFCLFKRCHCSPPPLPNNNSKILNIRMDLRVQHIHWYTLTAHRLCRKMIFGVWLSDIWLNDWIRSMPREKSNAKCHLKDKKMYGVMRAKKYISRKKNVFHFFLRIGTCISYFTFRRGTHIHMTTTW